jgi:hypothetical protein
VLAPALDVLAEVPCVPSLVASLDAPPGPPLVLSPPLVASVWHPASASASREAANRAEGVADIPGAALMMSLYALGAPRTGADRVGWKTIEATD